MDKMFHTASSSIDSHEDGETLRFEVAKVCKSEFSFFIATSVSDMLSGVRLEIGSEMCPLAT
jgi:hypothetical protein